KVYSERQLSKLIGFVFEHQQYYLLFDSAAKDDEAVLYDHARLDEPDFNGHLVRNPLESSIRAFGIPYKGKDVYLFRVTSKARRLDLELVERFGQYSRATLQKYIKAGYVRVNGEVIIRPKYDVSPLDSIALTPPEATDHRTSDLPIVYIDDNVIVVDKPAGVLTHSKGVLNDEFTVADFFRRYTTVGLDTTRPGIIHRLDRDTSGLIIGARNPETAKLLKQQFADRTVKKVYTAVVEGRPKNEQAIIDLPIIRNPSKPSTFRVDAKGKPAQTSYSVVTSNDKYSLLNLKPRTGRTHQLRVHLQYLNTPILGDRVYGHQSADRLYLHATELEITIPEGSRQKFESKIPSEFINRVKADAE
ncbi:hypothetical protein B7Y94_04220, partial [Candidatus Saccharibacteria bacterium 32-49-12]